MSGGQPATQTSNANIGNSNDANDQLWRSQGQRPAATMTTTTAVTNSNVDNGEQQRRQQSC